MMGGKSHCKMGGNSCGKGESSCKMKSDCQMSDMKCGSGDGVKEVIIKKLGDGENEIKVEVEKSK